MKNKKPQHQKSVTPEATKPPCDSNASAVAFERTHVQAVYDDIARHFSATRHTAWPMVVTFVDDALDREGDGQGSILDVGCGNGKYLRGGKYGYALGVDTCMDLIDMTKQIDNTSRIDVTGADILTLPVRNGCFDIVLCIAVVHHVCTRQRRIAAMRECVRVLRDGGQALFYVWAQKHNEDEHENDGEIKSKMMKRKFETQDLLVPWHLRKKKEGAENEKILADWHQVHRRFYHVYRKGELEAELGEIEEATTIKSYFDHQNWCVIVRKKGKEREKVTQMAPNV